MRFLDHYVNISGHHTYDLRECMRTRPFNFPSSRLLRPNYSTLSVLDTLRLKRITKSMDDAAMHKRIYHLWWHPHNFGANTGKNIEFLEKIIGHYKSLEERYGMKSLNMYELSQLSGAGDER